MEQETPRDKEKKKDKSPRHRLPGLCGSLSLMSLVSSICRPRHSLHILAVKNCIRIWTQFEGHLGQWNTSVTAPIILCSRQWTMNSIYNLLVHRIHWSKCSRSCIYPNCNKSHWGPTLLGQIFCTCPALTLFWKSVFDSLSAITSATTWPSPPVGVFVCVSYPVATVWHIFVELVAFLTLLAKIC